MAYTTTNFKTKKAMKEAVAAAIVLTGAKIEVFQPGPYGPQLSDGSHTIEGPHNPAPHTWYARVQVKDGHIVKVLS